jgi:phage terminase large subunit-like protein
MPEGAYFCAASADRVVRFIRMIRHFKGEFAGQPFDLLPWQLHEVFYPLFGWKVAPCKPHPYNKLCPQLRLYRGLYLETPKKNGKTQIGAGLGGYLAFGDGEPGAEIYTYAADKDQARLAFDALSFGVSYKGSPFERKGIRPLKTVVTNRRTRSFVKVQSSSVGTKHGPNAHGIIFDELHAQKTRDLWDVVTPGVANRRQPLVAALTTAGWDRNSVCFEQHEHARQVAEGIMDDPAFLGVVYSAAETDDWTKRETWYKVAPSLGVTVSESFYAQKALEAEQMPSAQNAFLQLFLSRWTQQAVRVIPLKAWDRGSQPVDLKAKKEVKAICYGGLDLASTTDLSALALLFPNADETIDAVVKYWIPGENIRARELRDRVPYQKWVDAGLIIATPGDVIDYSFIKADVLQAKTDFDLREISYDPWNAVQLVLELQDMRVKMAPMRQGFVSQSPPLKELLRLILQDLLHHGGNPVLRWNADSAASVGDAAGNIKLAKDKSTARIDGLAALVMALDAVLRHPAKKRRSVYETQERGVLTG